MWSAIIVHSMFDHNIAKPVWIGIAIQDLKESNPIHFVKTFGIQNKLVFESYVDKSSFSMD